MRFDKRCYKFSKTTNALTSYWLTLSLNRYERVSLPIVFDEKQRQRRLSAESGSSQQSRWLRRMKSGTLTSF